MRRQTEVSTDSSAARAGAAEANRQVATASIARIRKNPIIGRRLTGRRQARTSFTSRTKGSARNAPAMSDMSFATRETRGRGKGS